MALAASRFLLFTLSHTQTQQQQQQLSLSLALSNPKQKGLESTHQQKRKTLTPRTPPLIFQEFRFQNPTVLFMKDKKKETLQLNTAVRIQEKTKEEVSGGFVKDRHSDPVAPGEIRRERGKGN
jgi:hypothetical protein